MDPPGFRTLTEGDPFLFEKVFEARAKNVKKAQEVLAQRKARLEASARNRSEISPRDLVAQHLRIVEKNQQHYNDIKSTLTQGVWVFVTGAEAGVPNVVQARTLTELYNQNPRLTGGFCTCVGKEAEVEKASCNVGEITVWEEDDAVLCLLAVNAPAHTQLPPLPVPFKIDTGSAITTITTEEVQEFNLVPVGSIAARGFHILQEQVTLPGYYVSIYGILVRVYLAAKQLLGMNVLRRSHFFLGNEVAELSVPWAADDDPILELLGEYVRNNNRTRPIALTNADQLLLIERWARERRREESVRDARRRDEETRQERYREQLRAVDAQWELFRELAMTIARASVLEREVLLRRLIALLAQLPDQVQIVLRLRCAAVFHGLACPELASAL